MDDRLIAIIIINGVISILSVIALWVYARRYNREKYNGPRAPPL